ncbi:DUF1620-domain-containing protein [Basidiobolus meristosporus CBS 931.73]|uniref:ER membrane protein complex subunit 1 n=1 Tax=Basidiobolus meristosporus CBS 931.73 TaxID=1314790 RepID=A0A1Y1XW84_9FUNG|nr:DUF1620-domain-containing protein [Basidiobolus meristosporus CBS 931.73]|eukprot:ORX89945.1 DUF1620-domain-containing protein [Basidiobolus meristosporus CBS 931.73]
MRLLSGLRKTSSFFFLPLLLSLVAWKTTLALYEDHIGLVDWHKQNIGTPKVSGFYTVNNTRTFITATTKNVLSSVKSENGELVWRQVFQPDDTIHTMKVHNEQILTLSGQSTVAARLWDATSGHVVWETILSSETEQPLKSKKMVDAIFLEDGHIAASIHGKAVFKLQASTGAIVWNWESPADHVLFKISHDSQGVHLVGRNVGDREDKNLYVYRLSYAGEQVAAYKVECNAKHINNLILPGDSLWAHKLGFEGVTSEVSAETFLPPADTATNVFLDLQLYSLNLKSRTEFVLQFSQKEAGIFRVSDSGEAVAISLAYNFEPSWNTMFAGIEISPTEAYIALVATHEDLNIVESTIVDLSRDVAADSLKLTHDYSVSGTIKQVFIDYHAKDFQLLTVDVGASITLLNKKEQVWTRDESLAYANAAEFLDLPEHQLLSVGKGSLEDPEALESANPVSRYFRRIGAHLSKLVSVATHPVDFVTSLVTREPVVHDPTQLYRDTFGMRKLILFATENGKVVALDTNNKGKLIWSRLFQDESQHSRVSFQHLYIVRPSVVKLPPVVVVVGEMLDSKLQKVTVVYRLNALTGEDLHSEQQFSPSHVTLPFIAKKVVKLPFEDPVDKSAILAFVAEDNQFYLYPDHADASKTFAEHASSFYLTLGDTVGSSKIEGFQAVPNPVSSVLDLQQQWALNLPQDETIVAVGEKPSYEKIASLGRVLGNRAVLYKYLNPHVVPVVTYSVKEQMPVISMYLIDRVKGTILHHSLHQGGIASPAHPVHVAYCENWVVYQFWSDGDLLDGKEKGYVTVVHELFENEEEDMRVDSKVFSSFDEQRPYVMSQSFMFPEAVTAVGVTTTRNGITSREVLFALASGHIYGVSKRILDPRRPVGGLTEADKEEMLLQYDPLIPFDGKLALSYYLPVFGIKKILTSPSHLESTSLVVAYGLDTFFTREAPSKTFDILNEDFSKGMLLTTIAGLTAAVLIAGPIVRKKKLNALWG